MSDKIKDGGPAFPEQSVIAHGDMMRATTTPGMTLRDWFAGQALAGIIAYNGLVDHKGKSSGPYDEDTRDGTPDEPGETLHWPEAYHAYLVADAMLEAREAK